MKTSGQILGEQLARIREAAGLTVAELADKARSSRAWIYDVESAKKNVSPDEYDRLLACCGKTAEAAFAGFDRSGIAEDVRDLYWMLDRIVKAGDKDLIFGVRINLSAIAEQAKRLPKNRDSTDPSNGRETLKEEADTGTGSPPKHRKKKTS